MVRRKGSLTHLFAVEVVVFFFFFFFSRRDSLCEEKTVRNYEISGDNRMPKSESMLRGRTVVAHWPYRDSEGSVLF